MTDPSYLQSLLERAKNEKIADEPGWRKLLYLRTKSFGGIKSVIADPDFFLAGAAGRTDPSLELQASLARLLGTAPIKINEKTVHPQCIFAARLDYFQRRLGLDRERIFHASCPDLQDFIKFAEYNEASLVFSNYFADNPASMFGHTFLRLHRPRDGTKAGLLDDAVNFAAQVPSLNPLTYPFQGLLGYFSGKFALLPYSEKIQEYNNYESRDLWEYRLNLSSEELRRLTLAIWEVGYFWMNYYYLDENCSFMMLALLEAAKPELELTSQFNLYAIPSDTLKAVTDEPGLLKEITFRPSAQARYLERARSLNSEQRRQFQLIIGSFARSFNETKFFDMLRADACDVSCQVRVLDALIEYIDYKEKKISTLQVDEYAGLRHAVLLTRSKITQRSAILTARPEHQRPDLGPRSASLGLASGWTQQGGNITEFEWRPAFHDLSSRSLGFSDQLEIQIMDTVVARDAASNRAYLDRFRLLELTSLGQRELALSPFSWRFEAAHFVDRSLDPRRDFASRENISAALGTAWFRAGFGVYAMANFATGHSTDPDIDWFAGLGPHVGGFWNLGDRFKLSANWDFLRFFGNGQVDRNEISGRFDYFPSKTNEVYLELREMDRLTFYGAGFRFFY